MSSLGASKSELLASSVHDLFDAKSNDKAQQEKTQVAHKLLTEATHTTANDLHAQKEVVHAINNKLKADGLHAEGFGCGDQGSYLIVRPLNYGDSNKVKGSYHVGVSALGIVEVSTINTDKSPDRSKPKHDDKSKPPTVDDTKRKPAAQSEKPGTASPDQKHLRAEPQVQPPVHGPQDQTSAAPKSYDSPASPVYDDAKPVEVNKKASGTSASENVSVNPAGGAASILEAAKDSEQEKQNTIRANEAERLRVKQQNFEEAINQSNHFATEQEAKGKIRDGFRDAGRLVRFDSEGNLIDKPYRQTTVVDRANDPVLRKTIKEAQEKFGPLPPEERSAALTKYVNELLRPKNMTFEDFDFWAYGFTHTNSGKPMLLGDFIADGKGVFGQRATLLKVLGDEVGLDMRLVRGESYDHAWVDVKLPGHKERLVCDPRWDIVNAEYKDAVKHIHGERQGIEAPNEPHAQEPIANPNEQVMPGNDRIPAFLKSNAFTRGFAGGLGVFGVAAGLYQTVEGVKILMHGDTGLGLAVTTGGVANTGAGVLGLTMLREAAPAWMGSAAMKLGGVGTLLSGGVELYNGVKTGDNLQIGEGSMYTACGGLMLAAPPQVKMGAAVFAGSYGATRFAMEQTGGDRLATWAMDSTMNYGENSQASAISEQNISYLRENGNKVLGCSFDEMKANNVSAKEVSLVMLGLREKMAHMQGSDLDLCKAEVRRLSEIRGRLAS